MRLIDADALMQEFAEFVRDSNNSDFADVPTWNDAVSLLGSAPTIEERKTGKWEEKAVSDEKVIDEWQSARCSACGKYHTAPYMYYFNNYNYCPNCGARMTEEDV